MGFQYTKDSISRISADEPSFFGQRHGSSTQFGIMSALNLIRPKLGRTAPAGPGLLARPAGLDVVPNA
jgi:hypothetical protein